MLVVAREVVCDAAFARVHVPPAEGLLMDVLPGRSLDERRPREEDAPLVLDDDILISHRRDVRTPCCRMGITHYVITVADVHMENAVPATEMPCTRAICGMPSADI